MAWRTSRVKALLTLRNNPRPHRKQGFHSNRSFTSLLSVSTTTPYYKIPPQFVAFDRTRSDRIEREEDEAGSSLVGCKPEVLSTYESYPSTDPAHESFE